MLLVNTALSTHTACFICREKTRGLHQVKKKDIIYAYATHKIYIKHHSRLCDAHFDEYGFIRKEEFSIIPTKQRYFDKSNIKMFDVLCQSSENIFDQFKSKKALEEEHCKTVTGWSRDTFFEFSDYVLSVNHNKHRSKFQLIALYLYWLKSGMTQKNLALIFGKNITQRCISRYLDQIRLAIYKDFVPFYLGADRERNFFLRYNTVMTQNIFGLENDILVFVADGTSCRIQKSNNNEFQYKTYSVQKNDSLFKPFIICGADGYIVDCYGQ